jgi:hypothetical protein
VTINNLPPAANAGGTYTVPFGGSVVLSGAATDPGGTGDVLTYQWDLNGDGVFGETGAAATNGNEVGPTPTFQAAGLAAGSSVAVHLLVTDQGGLTSTDTATIHVVNVADLSISSPDISFAPVNPSAGEPVAIFANVTNEGLADATNVKVSFYASGNWLGDATIPDLPPGASAQASFTTSFATASLQLITVKVNPDNAILETNTSNNQASRVLQVGQPSLAGASIVIQAPAASGYQGQAADVGGSAVYAFTSTSQNFPVQGAAVTVTVIEPATQNVLGVYTGARTDVNGNFSQPIVAPASLGTYTLLVQVTDGTVTSQVQSTLTVAASSQNPIQPTSPPYIRGGPVTDAFVTS